MKHNRLLFVALVCFSLFSIELTAQAAVDSENPAEKNSYLELKENDKVNHGANSTQWPKLPQVELEKPSKLTIDVESKKNEYVGTIVYNKTNNTTMRAGIYMWNGTQWLLQTVSAHKGEERQNLVKSGGKLASKDSSLSRFDVVGEMTFQPSKTRSFWYSYAAMTKNPLGWAGESKPDASLFRNDFVYSDSIEVPVSGDKKSYMFVSCSFEVEMKTVGNRLPKHSFWEELSVDFLLDGVVRYSFTHLYNTPAGTFNADREAKSAAFELPANPRNGKHLLQIRFRIGKNGYKAVAGTSSGSFNPTENQFIRFSVKDVSGLFLER